ncbi:hypothetical protein BJ944DRAFT_240098 [Cunninghamella echinulata]|nr:hypothetical protein BJ944DRAFT_240098 [Cunninghamella echinulata]
MLFLSAWDRYLPAYFKGAPKVCNHCRKTGHIKKECPALADIKCYNCNGKGHISRNCRKFYTQDKEKSFNEEIDSYIVDSKETKAELKKEKKKTKDSNNNNNSEDALDNTEMEINVDGSKITTIPMEEDTAMDQIKSEKYDDLYQHSPEKSLTASKHAPYDKATC